MKFFGSLVAAAAGFVSVNAANFKDDMERCASAPKEQHGECFHKIAMMQQEDNSQLRGKLVRFESNLVGPTDGNAVEDPSKVCYGEPPLLPFRFAETARWMAHQNVYGVMSTLSTFSNMTGHPFGNVRSFSDGAVGGSTGKLHFYASAMDVSMRDLREDDRVSFTVSQEMVDSYCSDRDINPMSPTCARLTLSGNIRFVCSPQSGTEYEVCTEEYMQEMEQVLFDRHPAMAGWPDSHDWGFYEIDISQIWIISFFGAAQFVDPDAYFAIDC